MSKFNLIFEEIFVLSSMALNINRSHPSIVRDYKWMCQFLLIVATSLTTCAFLTYSILFHDIKSGKITEASKNAAMVIVFFTITFKYITLLKHQQSINYIISIIQDDYNIAKEYSEEEKAIVLNYAKRGVTVCRFWLVFGFGTGSIFPLKAFALMGYSYWQGEFVLVPMFDLTYPERIDVYKNDVPVFWSLFLICFIFVIYAGSMYVGFDPLVPIFMLHTCGQLDLLSRLITKAFVDAEDSTEIKENLKTVIIKLQGLYSLVDRVKSNFNVLYEYNMKATTFILPLATLVVVDNLRDGNINIEFISFLIGCALHFYMPCYYSDLLMETSEKFRQAIYSCGWEKYPDKRLRHTVLFMLTRANDPMVIGTVFYEMNLDTFAEMCRQSYGILNLINAACN